MEESLEIHPHICSQLGFKRVEIHSRKGIVSSINRTGKVDYHTKNEAAPLTLPAINTNSTQLNT